MNFIQRHKAWLRFYYYLGILPSHIGFKPKFWQIHTVAKYGQAVSTIFLSVYIIVYAQKEGSKVGIRLIEGLIMGILDINFIVTIAAILFQNIFYRCAIEQILTSFCSIENNFRKFFRHEIPYKSFARLRKNRIYIICAARLTHLIVYSTRRILYPSLSTVMTPANCLRFQFIAILLYVQFFIDAIAFFANALNDVIRDSALRKFDRTHRICSDCHFEQIHDELLQYKMFHFQLWTLCEKFNQAFGWCIIACMLNMSTDLLYSAFWLFDEIKKHNGFVRSLRKIQI